MHLEAASMNKPDGLAELIADLGTGENGFGGTPVATGEQTLEQYLQRCIDMTDAAKLQPGYVPQTVFWVIDEKGEAIGMVRVRHYLNDRLRDQGGHVGYYIRRDKRNKGYGKVVLQQALEQLRKIGEKRAMLTVHMDNIASIKVIEANAGVFESEGLSADGHRFGRFWIELNEGKSPVMTFVVRNQLFEIHPITQDELEDVLEVYRQCEDFLALGPVPTASMGMVLKDLEISQAEHGIFCGIYTATGKMIGIIDYVPNNYDGEPQTGFLELLMIAAPFRKQGIGAAVVEVVENEIRKDGTVNKILSGVQVNNPQAVQFWQRHGYRIVSEPRLHPDQTTAVDLQKDFAGGPGTTILQGE